MVMVINPDRIARGKPVGTGHCVALLQHHGLPLTKHWRRGQQARGSALQRGVAIATFSDAGEYENAMDGRSHAAILLEETPEGLLVLDQWLGRPVGERLIRFKNGGGQKVDDGDAYFSVEVVQTA